jgi:hypothetical protein
MVLDKKINVSNHHCQSSRFWLFPNNVSYLPSDSIDNLYWRRKTIQETQIERLAFV